MSNKATPTDSNEMRLEPIDKESIDAKEIELKVVSPKAGSDPTAEVLPKEINGPKGLEPTRYGDWESKGRCYDF